VKSKVALAVAIALALLAAVGIRAYLRGEREKFVGKSKKVPILVAKTKIAKGTMISGEMVDTDMVDQRAVLDNRMILETSFDRINRQRIMRNVNPGEPLYWHDFGSPAERALPSASLIRGYRHITIPVDKVTGCAGRLLPGTIVDVLVTLRVRRTPNAPVQPVTQTVLTGVEVKATDLRTRRPYEYLTAKEQRDFAAYSTVTLVVQPLQANLLAFLADQGKMHLVIRSPGDDTGSDPGKIDKVTLENLDVIIKKASEEKPPQVKTAPKE